MQFKILVVCFLLAITACAPAPSAATVPSAPLNAASAPAPQAPTQVGLPNNAASVPAIAPEKCATQNAAPLDQFRSDPPSKLVSNKPRLVEFFAFW